MKKFLLALVPIVAILGCAPAHPIHLDNDNIARITYRPQDCQRLRDQRVLCKNVVFEEKTVSVKQLKEK